MRTAVALGAFLALWAGSAAYATNCATGACHKAVVGAKFLHGPVAAEFAGGEGCVSCHVPAGPPCTATKGGQFTFKTKKERLCLLCHERGTATQHTRTRQDCLSCHNPHRSDASDKLLRAGKSEATPGSTKPK